MLRKEETICAPATSAGGAIVVIRISGQRAIEICREVFFPSDNTLDIATMKGYRVAYGDIRDGEELVDEVLMSLFRKPHSYTGEDMAEISCHGSPYIAMRILELLVKKGAVTARPGEFTMRAFLNGKMDLSQAEGVADLIASGSKTSHRIALNQMRGGFSSEIAALRSELLHFASMIELELDFGEEEVEFADRGQLRNVAEKVRDVAVRLSESFRLGNIIRNGIPVAITGKPNSGKSTLLNALLNEEKAIVSEIPGTTRDTIEDTLVIEGLVFRFIDTAGLRETPDFIENLGIQRTHEKIRQASLILLVDDPGDSPETIRERIRAIKTLMEDSDKKLLVVVNKKDKISPAEIKKIESGLREEAGDSLIFISAKEKTGLEELKNSILRLTEADRIGREDIIVTNARHFEALNYVAESLDRVISGLDTGLPEDLIAMDIRQAIHYLGEITGEITTDELLDNIFKNFCIGK